MRAFSTAGTGFRMFIGQLYWMNFYSKYLEVKMQTGGKHERKSTVRKYAWFISKYDSIITGNRVSEEKFSHTSLKLNENWSRLSYPVLSYYQPLLA
jgi:hypothetical protein